MPGTAPESQQETCGHPAPRSSCPMPRRPPCPRPAPQRPAAACTGRLRPAVCRQRALPHVRLPVCAAFPRQHGLPRVDSIRKLDRPLSAHTKRRAEGAHGCAAASSCAAAARGTAGAPNFPCIQPLTSRDPLCPVPSSTAATAASSLPNAILAACGGCATVEGCKRAAHRPMQTACAGRPQARNSLQQAAGTPPPHGRRGRGAGRGAGHSPCLRYRPRAALKKSLSPRAWRSHERANVFFVFVRGSRKRVECGAR